jgi:hypothetical protein
MTNQMVQLFEMLIERVNETESHRQFVRRWVGGYQGKVLQLETDDGSFHVILKKDGSMRLQAGSYPSPDIVFKATTQTLMNLFTGRADFRDLVKRWELVIIGAGHEAVPLAKLVFEVLKSSQT